MKIETVDGFKAFVKEVEAREGYVRPAAFGIGLAHLDSGRNWLSALFPAPNFRDNYGTAAVFSSTIGRCSESENRPVYADTLRAILDRFTCYRNDDKIHPNIQAVERILRIVERVPNMQATITFVDEEGLTKAPTTMSDAYLRLHLLSHRLVKPNEICLDGIFGLLPNVAWTNEGPISLEDLPVRRMEALARGQYLRVHSVDKIPPMADFVVPSGVRVADAARVRLGGYVGPGSTVMHEGFINFNAGCEGPNMVEGRISAGVWVGEGTDIGGSFSTMGKLSGGGKERVSVGKRCLLGANAGIGIALGDECTVEAGLYVTAGMPVVMDSGKIVRARELSGKPGLLFRRNGRSGAVEVLEKANLVELNAELHAKQ